MDKDKVTELLNELFTRTYEELNRKLGARTAGICLTIIDNVISDMLEEESR